MFAQECEEFIPEVSYLSVDKEKTQYFQLASLINFGDIVMPFHSRLLKELRELRDTGSKIDHPSTGCFTGDTEILLSDGSTISIRELSELQTLPQLISYNECWGFATSSIPRKCWKTKVVDKVLVVTFSSGDQVKCTLDHLFLNLRGQYIPARFLKIGDSLKCVDGLKTLTVKSTELLEGEFDVYDIEVPHYSNFSLGCGVFVHNSKDLADAVCGAVWNCVHAKNPYMNILGLYGESKEETLLDSVRELRFRDNLSRIL